MGAESSLPFRRVRMPYATELIWLAVLLAALALLVFAVLLVPINPDLSPGSEPQLMGPFRWRPAPTGA